MSFPRADRKLFNAVVEPSFPPVAETSAWKLCSRSVKVESVVLEPLETEPLEDESVEDESVEDEVRCEPAAVSSWIRLCRSLAGFGLAPLAVIDVVPVALPPSEESA